MNGSDKENGPDGPAADLSECVCFNLRKASRAVTQLFDTVLAEHKLRITQFSILAVLMWHGKARRMSDLAQDLVMDRTTLTRNLKPLERAGYLQVLPGADKRERLAALTDAGRAMMESAMPQWHEAQAQAVALLGDGRWPAIRKDLSVFAAKLHTPPSHQD